MEGFNVDISVKWKENMCFEGRGESAKSILMDVPGDGSKGLTPMEMVLVGLGGCTGMDVISILKKMRVEIEDLNIEINAERADEHPKKFTKINLKYKLTGSKIDEKKVEKAIALTADKYCSVIHSLDADITNSYEIN